MTKTGPKTETGKAVTKMNAVRHGINSNSPVIAGLESDEEWQNYRLGTIEALAPVGALEVMLAERIVLQAWRLQRVARYERGAIETQQEKVENDVVQRLDGERSWLLSHESGKANRFLLEMGVERSIADSINDMFPDTPIDATVDRRGKAIATLQRERLLPDEATLNRITRYEAHLAKQFYQALHELEAIQTRRNGGSSPLARLEINGRADTADLN